MRRDAVKTLLFRGCFAVLHDPQDTPPWSRRSPRSRRRYRRRRHTVTTCPSTARAHSTRTHAGGFVIVGAGGSDGPSIRVGDPVSRTPETLREKPGSESPFSSSVPLGTRVF